MVVCLHRTALTVVRDAGSLVCGSGPVRMLRGLNVNENQGLALSSGCVFTLCPPPALPPSPTPPPNLLCIHHHVVYMCYNTSTCTTTLCNAPPSIPPSPFLSLCCVRSILRAGLRSAGKDANGDAGKELQRELAAVDPHWRQ